MEKTCPLKARHRARVTVSFVLRRPEFPPQANRQIRGLPSESHEVGDKVLRKFEVTSLMVLR